jgi:ElaB/YqjD/DUF883 family membrane-anchored ribosome-binding protein
MPIEERKHPTTCEIVNMESEEPTNPPTTPTQASSLLEYVEKNPVAAVVQALAIGFAVGMLVRLLEGGKGKEKEINVKRKPSLDEAKFHLGSLVLPFLWPAWQKAQDGVGISAETVRDAVEKLKKSDLKKEGKKRLREAEKWAEKEAEHLAELSKSKAKDVEKWVEDEILPAAECGWKKLRKFFG